MLTDFLNTPEINVLERVLQFSGQRHNQITNNIANLSTPNYQPKDVDPAEFQAVLRDMVEKSKITHPALKGKIEPKNARTFSFNKDSITMKPEPIEQNIMFHDRNDRDLERTMQSLAENVMVYRQSIELLRSRFSVLKSAIRGTVR